MTAEECGHLSVRLSLGWGDGGDRGGCWSHRMPAGLLAAEERAAWPVSCELSSGWAQNGD